MSESPTKACRNCGTSLSLNPPPNWCPHCGQETQLHPPTLREFLHEFIGHYVALEGTLWRTLRSLLLQPGHLTREYLDGRRRRYLPPLRLYLSASFIFFLVVKVAGLGGSLHPGLSVSPSAPVEAAVPQVTADNSPPRPASRNLESAATSAPSPNLQAQKELAAWSAKCQAAEQPCSAMELRAASVIERLLYRDDPWGDFFKQLTAVAPYVLFLMLPVFAGLMRLGVYGSELTYGAHYVFGLHLHALWFLMLLTLAPLPEAATGPVLAVVWLHGVASIRRVYGLTWSSAVIRAVLVSLLYFSLLVVICSVGVVTWLLMWA